MPGREGLFKPLQEYPQPSDEIIRFDVYRRRFEKRLSEFREVDAERLAPIADWMQLVVSEKAPELLNYLK